MSIIFSLTQIKAYFNSVYLKAGFTRNGDNVKGVSHRTFKKRVPPCDGFITYTIYAYL
jgi:hypothetical protein